MPFGDRTGPEGKGPRTGRRAGYCSGYKMPGHLNRNVRGLRYFSGRMSRFGRFRGRRFRR